MPSRVRLPRRQQRNKYNYYKDDMKRKYLKPKMTVFEIVTSCLLQGSSKSPTQGEGTNYGWGDEG